MATIVALHAHPDDEALLTGGWLAQRSAAGDQVVLVFATDGDAGLSAVPRVGTAGSLGQLRRAEAAASARALGAARVVWLGYADSGMPETPTANLGRFVDTAVDDAARAVAAVLDEENAVVWLGYADSGMPETPTANLGRFVDTAVDDAARAVAAVLDEENADVLTGYDPNGGYGHPDHVHVHLVARAAQAIAAKRPRLLEATLDRTWLLRAVRALRPFAGLLPGITLPVDNIYTARMDLSLTIDVRDQLTQKRAALAAHASQTGGGVRTVAILLALPRPLARRILGTEWFLEVP